MGETEKKMAGRDTTSIQSFPHAFRTFEIYTFLSILICVLYLPFELHLYIWYITIYFLLDFYNGNQTFKRRFVEQNDREQS